MGNAGATDANCAQCADGYQWWPCNDDRLCQCSGSALVQVDPKMVPIKRATRSKSQKAFSCARSCHASGVLLCTVDTLYRAQFFTCVKSPAQVWQCHTGLNKSIL